VAEQHSPGTQKMFYHAHNCRAGLDVTVEICRSTNETSTEILELMESVRFPGVYFFRYLFEEGVYLAAFFENNIRTVSQVYRINRPEGMKFRGPNVVG